jgi:hypothetical protein
MLVDAACEAKVGHMGHVQKLLSGCGEQAAMEVRFVI